MKLYSLPLNKNDDLVITEISMLDLPHLFGRRLKDITISVMELNNAIQRNGDARVVSYITQHLAARIMK